MEMSDKKEYFVIMTRTTLFMNSINDIDIIV